MKRITIPLLKKDVSVIGLGTMIFNPEKKHLVFDLLNTFLKQGGNLIDTAEIYGDPEEYGFSETAIGLWLQSRKKREDVIILSKGCIPGTCKPLHPHGAELSPKGIHDAISGSLERLHIEYLDMWMLHRDDPKTPVGVFVDALNEEIEKGRILSYGVSNWNVSRIVEAEEYAAEHNLIGIAASSPHFSLAIAKEPYWPDTVVTSSEDKKWYAENQMPLFAWSSLGRGFFGRGSPEYTDDKDLVRVFYSNENFERLRRAQELGQRKGVRAIEIALAYVVNQNFPVVALVGPACVEELLSCCRGANISLSEDEIKWLNLEKEH
jgi:aryl-alcohol dehydrogenase-like predicted oxidoreductase